VTASLLGARGSTLAEAAFEYAAERAAFLGNHPAADEQGHAESCQRLAAQVTEWPSQGD
jgi:hypothetical protein